MTLVPTIRTEVYPKKASDLTKKEREQLKRDIPIGLSRAAQSGVNIILDRTAKGQGIDGPFQRYSDRWLKTRRELGLRTHPVTLEFGLSRSDDRWINSPTMLSQMASKPMANHVKIYFTGKDAQKKAAMNNKTRPFFGFNDGEVDEMTEVFRKYVFRGFRK